MSSEARPTRKGNRIIRGSRLDAKLGGHSRRGTLTARGSFYHTVRLNRQQRQTVTDPTTIATLEALVEDGVVPDDDIIRTEELYTLEQQRVANRTQDGWEVNP